MFVTESSFIGKILVYLGLLEHCRSWNVQFPGFVYLGPVKRSSIGSRVSGMLFNLIKYKFTTVCVSPIIWVHTFFLSVPLKVSPKPDFYCGSDYVNINFTISTARRKATFSIKVAFPN